MGSRMVYAMASRKYVCFCSIFITILVLSSKMNAKLFSYSSTESSYISTSDGLPRLKNYSGSTSNVNLSISNFSTLSFLVKKCISSSSYALLNQILSSVSAHTYFFHLSEYLPENETFYFDNRIIPTKRLPKNVSSESFYTTLNECIPRSGTNSKQEVNRSFNVIPNINWRSRLDVQDHSSSRSQDYFKHSNVTYSTQTNEMLGSCPVYTGKNVPPYVYQYRLSGSKYRQLLAGLALYNLGAIYLNQSMYKYHKRYIPKPDEICMFGVRYENGTRDEMAIDCRTITHFILTEQSLPLLQNKETALKTFKEKPELLNSSTTVVPNYQNMLLNPGYLTKSDENNNIQVFTSYHNQIQSANKDSDRKLFMTAKSSDKVIQKVKTFATEVVNATDPIFYGKPVNVTSKMECYVSGTIRSLNMKKAVPCQVLQKYTVRSVNSCSAIMVKSLIMVALKLLFCYNK